MFESILSLIFATALLLGSPGPAPLALAATGATYGIKKGTPFLLGILMGLLFAIVGAALGLSTLFSAFPNVRLVAQVLGALYIVYIAAKIAFASIVTTNASLIPPRFRDGFILNLLNPKAYAAFMAIFSQFLVPYSDFVTSYLMTGVICMLVAAAVDLIWLCFGGMLKPIFSNPKQARVIRILFALLMIAAVIFGLF